MAIRWFVLFFIYFTNGLFAQTKTGIDQPTLKQSATAQANQMATLFKTGDYKGYVKYIHPFIVEGAGGEAKMIELLNKQNAQLKSKGVTINSIVLNPPSEVVKSKNELQCTISQHTEMKACKGEGCHLYHI